MAAHLSCVCGKVALSLASPVPRLRLECGCCDCRQALQWGEVQGGPPAPLIVDATYFEDRFTFLKGRELTSWMKLRESGNSTRCIATCCHSTLLVNHEFYQGVIVMVMRAGCKLTLPSGDGEKIARVQMKDVPKDKIPLIHPFQGQPVDPEALDTCGLEGIIKAFTGALEKEVAGVGRSSKEEMEERGVTVLGLEHYKWLL